MQPISNYIRKISSKILKDIHKAQNSKKITVFLGGLCADGNAWRKDVKAELKDKIYFIDPFDKNWDPTDNIYDELAGMLIADHVIFYRGGKGSKNEQKFLDIISEKYKSFKDLDKLKSYLVSLKD